jgi:glycerol-3-phosphate dehydrogenase
MRRLPLRNGSMPNPANPSTAPLQEADILIIGGGINGAGIARDLAGRGARVVLVERGDLASGTSSASTKLIHGGLRYLEHREFGLVREALSEREVLWGIAPHIIWPLRLVLPHTQGLRPRWLLRLGLWVYDTIGKRKHLPRSWGVTLARHPAGAALSGATRHGFEFSDCWVDDARLVVLNAQDAAARGAHICTRTEVTAATRHADHWQVQLTRADGSTLNISPKLIVNAGGPNVLGVLGLAQLKSRNPIRLVRGSHIVVRALFAHEYAYFFQLPDGRIFFAIPYEQDFTLIGTTDADHEGALTEVKASAEEIAYLCAAANQYFQAQISPADIVWSYAGVRPLVDTGGGKPEEATRGYSFELDAQAGQAPILSIFGGKITTYRHLAEAACAHIGTLLPLPSKSWTWQAPLPGGDFPRKGAAALATHYRAAHPFLSAAEALRITRTYGTAARQWLGAAHSRTELGEDFGAGLSAAEIDYLQREEWAVTAEDIIWRRTKLGLHLSPAQIAAIEHYITKKATSCASI